MKENCEIIYKSIETNEEYEKTIRKVVNECFEVEKLQSTNLYMSITLTEPEEIRKMNRKYRNIDKATDVLSFPMFEKGELDHIIQANLVENVEEDLPKMDILGDIVISIPKVYEQAKEYGHSFERELSYMVVHGFYHLMGYDHMIEEDKKIMRAKEEVILNKLGISRGQENDEEGSTLKTENVQENTNHSKSKEQLTDENETVNEKAPKNKNFLDAWKNAINGIIYATTTQGNIKKQLIIAVLVVIISLFFELTKAEFLIFMFTIILIIFAEMVNTAIETVVDLYTDLYHPKAKIAKDVAAGGVVITAINAVIVAYFLFFDKISNIGLQFIRNIATSPVHLAFAAVIIVIIGILSLIAMATTNKHKLLNKKFMPSGHAALSFAANTIIWLLTDNIVILTLSLVMAILVSESRVESKTHRLSEVVFSSCVGIITVLIIYGLAMLAIQ